MVRLPGPESPSPILSLLQMLNHSHTEFCSLYWVRLPPRFHHVFPWSHCTCSAILLYWNPQKPHPIFPGKVEEQPHPWDGLFLEAEDPPTEFSKIMDSNRERRNSGGKKGNWLALFVFIFFVFALSAEPLQMNRMTYVYHMNHMYSYVTYQHRILLSCLFSLSG